MGYVKRKNEKSKFSVRSGKKWYYRKIKKLNYFWGKIYFGTGGGEYDLISLYQDA